MIKLSCLKIVGILIVLNALSSSVVAASLSPQAQDLQTNCRCQPQNSCWPKAADWERLAKQLKGRLIKPVSAIAPCEKNANSAACSMVLKNIHNPFFLEASPGNAQSQGWLGAWKYSNSTYVVEAENTADVVAAVNFAREHRIRLVIKGTGHDYQGRSNAPNSLLVWTHKMKKVKFDNSFSPLGCPTDEKNLAVVTVGAGSRWLQAYDEVTTKHGRYVQGDGCTTGGAAGGFTQGGGFGSFSKKYGMAAASIIQAEIVTADGKTLIANKCQNKDLFWAIRGGGAGTFGIVTQMTLKTHELPLFTGIFQGTIAAKNDAAYKELLQQFMSFFRHNLNNEHWGEKISFTAKNTITIFLLYQGENQEAAEQTWLPMRNWINQQPELFTFKTKFWSIPARKLWDLHFWEKTHPEFISQNIENGKATGQFWWTPNNHEVYNYWYTYQSWWLPTRLLEASNIKNLADIFFNASRTGSISMHINKGLGGASAAAVRNGRETAVNPAVFDATALVIMAAGSNQVYPGVAGHEPHYKEIRETVKKINNAMKHFTNAAPQAGTYLNEADYFQKDWPQDFWGKNYANLLKVKQKYDPLGFFYCHHCVGSELWTHNGMCPIAHPAK